MTKYIGFIALAVVAIFGIIMVNIGGESTGKSVANPLPGQLNKCPQYYTLDVKSNKCNLQISMGTVNSGLPKTVEPNY